MTRHDSPRPRPGATTTIDLQPATAPRSVAILADRTGGDRARRRLRLHHLLVRRRRWSKELDRLLYGELAPLVLTQPAGDPWHDWYMDRGWVERHLAGQELAGAGWSP